MFYMVNDRSDNRRRNDRNMPLHNPWDVWPLHPKNMDDQLNAQNRHRQSKVQENLITPEPVVCSYLHGEEDSKPDYSSQEQG